MNVAESPNVSIVSSSHDAVIQNTLHYIISHLRETGQYLLTTTKRIWYQFPPLRPLLVYSTILSLFSLLECFIAFTLSHSLVVLFCAFYTVHRALHYLIIVLGYVLEKQQAIPNALFVPYSYGYRRLEVILRFSNGIFAIFIAFAFCTEGIQRLVEPHHFHMDYMTVFAFVGIVTNFIGVYLFSPTGGVASRKGLVSSSPYPSPYSYKNFSLSSMSSNNTWQEYAMSALFSVQNHLRKQRQFMYEYLVEAHLHLAVFVTAILFTTFGDNFDVLIVLLETLITIYFAYPLIIEASAILLQTTPESVLVQLGRCVSEASKLEDVLECHGEHFWTVCPPISSSSKVHVIGSIKVRVVESANEQTVLRNVQRVFAEKKAFTIELTIQVEKRSLIEGSSPSIAAAMQTPNIVQQNDSTIINIGNNMEPSEQIFQTKDQSSDSRPQLTTTISILSSHDDLDSGEGLGLFVNDNDYEDDEMFGKLRSSGTNLMRQRDHSVGSRQPSSPVSSGTLPRISSTTAIDNNSNNKSISPQEENDIVHSSTPTTIEQELTTKEE